MSAYARCFTTCPDPTKSTAAQGSLLHHPVNTRERAEQSRRHDLARAPGVPCYPRACELARERAASCMRLVDMRVLHGSVPWLGSNCRVHVSPVEKGPCGNARQPGDCNIVVRLESEFNEAVQTGHVAMIADLERHAPRAGANAFRFASRLQIRWKVASGPLPRLIEPPPDHPTGPVLA